MCPPSFFTQVCTGVRRAGGHSLLRLPQLCTSGFLLLSPAWFSLPSVITSVVFPLILTSSHLPAPLPDFVSPQFKFSPCLPNSPSFSVSQFPSATSNLPNFL